MVSTRGIRYRFTEGERVLCYEPDPTKAKVLYDSKVLGVVETRDKRGKKILQYKIHFQGWNSSWDRRVNADFVLKDTSENRQLQRDLAEKAQLQLAAYLYRREKRKRSRTSTSTRNRVSSEDGSSCSAFDRNDFEDLMKDEFDSETSSIESSCIDDEKLHLQVGDALKQILDYDREMILTKNKQHILPAKLPAVNILENFVKHSTLKLVFSSQLTTDNGRRRTLQQKREINLEKLNNTVSLLKEVVDGLRTYLDFCLKDHLLYKPEKEQGEFVLSEENLKTFTYVASENDFSELLNLKLEKCLTPAGTDVTETTNENSHQDSSDRRRLRSYKAPTEIEATSESTNCPPQEAVCVVKLEKLPKESLNSTEFTQNISSILDNQSKHDIKHDPSNQEYLTGSVISTSSNGSTPHSHNIMATADYTKVMPPLNSNVSLQTREFLQNVFAWQILPSNAPPEASMIFGAVHLARLITKLPHFLNVVHMPEDKLTALIPLLDSFSKYLESHKEWYGEHNYKDKSTTSNSST